MELVREPPLHILLQPIIVAKAAAQPCHRFPQIPLLGGQPKSHLGLLRSCQTRLTSTCVSLKQAPSARSALRSAETSAEIVCPVRLVASHAPFSLATTPGGTRSLTASGRITSPRPFQTRTSAPPARPRTAASCGFISSGGGRSEPGRWPSVDEMRLSEDGEIRR